MVRERKHASRSRWAVRARSHGAAGTGLRQHDGPRPDRPACVRDRRSEAFRPPRGSTRARLALECRHRARAARARKILLGHHDNWNGLPDQPDIVDVSPIREELAGCVPAAELIEAGASWFGTSPACCIETMRKAKLKPAFVSMWWSAIAEDKCALYKDKYL